MDNENTAANQSGKSLNSGSEVRATESVNPPETGKPATNGELQEVKKELTGYEKSTLLWTRVVVGINLITCFFVALQWRAMNGQLYEMRSEQRPYISADKSCLILAKDYPGKKETPDAICESKGAIFATAKPEQGFIWAVQMKNASKTPAAKATFEAAWCIGDPDISHPPKLEDCRQQYDKTPARTVFPDTDPWLAIGPKEFSLKTEELEAIENQVKAFYIVGHAEYGNGRYWTNVCLYYTPDNGKWPLRYCKGGQDTDQDKQAN